MSYIGETGRSLQKRLTEHKAAVRRGDQKNGVAVHVQNNDHRVDWEAAHVIEQEPWYWPRRVREAIHIANKRGFWHPPTWTVDSSWTQSGSPPWTADRLLSNSKHAVFLILIPTHAHYHYVIISILLIVLFVPNFCIMWFSSADEGPRTETSRTRVD